MLTLVLFFPPSSNLRRNARPGSSSSCCTRLPPCPSSGLSASCGSSVGPVSCAALPGVKRSVCWLSSGNARLGVVVFAGYPPLYIGSIALCRASFSVFTSLPLPPPPPPPPSQLPRNILRAADILAGSAPSCFESGAASERCHGWRPLPEVAAAGLIRSCGFLRCWDLFSCART